MTEHFALYSTARTVPDDEMVQLCDDVSPTRSESGGEVVYRYEWTDLSITCRVMPESSRAEHLDGFAKYVRTIAHPQHSERTERLVRRILGSTVVVGVEVAPERDLDGRTEDAVGKLAVGLGGLLFFENALYDQHSRLLLGPDGSFEEDARWN